MPQRDPKTGRFIKVEPSMPVRTMVEDVPLFAFWPWMRCKVMRPGVTDLYWGRCDLKRNHPGPHAKRSGWGAVTW